MTSLANHYQQWIAVSVMSDSDSTYVVTCKKPCVVELDEAVEGIASDAAEKELVLGEKGH